MEKRYQIFISSTYTDLIDERQAVLEAILELDHMPSGMELFPAANQEQWDLIKQVIDDCDYYIVIVGGKYGSKDSEGISFTEREYRYALEKNKPVLGFIHKNPKDLPAKKYELDEESRKKLDDFKALVKQKLVKFYSNKDDLKSMVIASLVKLIKKNPATGWIRADNLTNSEAMKEILDLRRENDSLKSKLHQVQFEKPKDSDLFVQGDDPFAIGYSFDVNLNNRTRRGLTWSYTPTINRSFSLIAPLLTIEGTEESMKEALSKGIYQDRIDIHKINDNFDKNAVHINFKILDSSFEKLKIQVKALGFIKPSSKSHGVNDKSKYWTLTPYGDKIMTELVAEQKPFVRFAQMGIVEEEYKILLLIQDVYDKDIKCLDSIFEDDCTSFSHENGHVIELELVGDFPFLFMIDKLSFLRELSLTYIDWTQDAFPALENLKGLSLTECAITDSAYKNLSTSFPNLSELIINNERLEEIPDGITSLKNLKFLSILSKKYIQIPTSISNLTYLETLELDHSSSFIPNELLEIRKLNQLEIQKIKDEQLQDESLKVIEKLEERKCNIVIQTQTDENSE